MPDGSYREVRPPAPRFVLTDGGVFRLVLVVLGATRHGAWGVGRVAFLVGVSAWLPLLAASIAQHVALGWRGAFLFDVGLHLRLLVALPLGLWAERPIARRFEHAIEYLFESCLIADDNREAALASIVRAERLRDLRSAEIVLALLAIGLSGVDLSGIMPQTETWIFPGERTEFHASIAGWIYLIFSAPLIRFVALRWAWRMVVLTVLFAGLARAPLHLDPAHPDASGGLSVLFGAHTSFGWLTLASSTALAGALWTEKILTARSVLDYRAEVIAIALVLPVVFLLPAFVFAWPLEKARRRFHADYGTAAADFAARYARQWIDPATRARLPLGTEETSAHTDLVTSFDSVRRTHWVPFARAHYLTLFVASALPVVVFTMQEIPVLVLLKRVKDAIG